jgi:hypothetical protein
MQTFAAMTQNGLRFVAVDAETNRRGLPRGRHQLKFHGGEAQTQSAYGEAEHERLSVTRSCAVQLIFIHSGSGSE